MIHLPKEAIYGGPINYSVLNIFELGQTSNSNNVEEEYEDTWDDILHDNEIVESDDDTDYDEINQVMNDQKGKIQIII